MRRVLVFLPLVGLLPAQHVIEATEPNQTVGSATPLPCVAEGVGALSTPVDADWWSVTLASPAELFAETMPGTGGQIGDTILTLIDAGGAPLVTNDNGVGSGYYSRLHASSLAAGTYLLVVERGAQAAASGSYLLDVRCGPLATTNGATLVAEGPENNDARVGGIPTTVPVPSRCTGTLASTGTGGDWDFYRFTLAQASLLRVTVAATATHPSTPRADDPVLYLYADGAPPTLLASAFAGSDYAVWDAELVVRLAAGVYQVAVRGFDESTTGSYYLDLRRVQAADAATDGGGCAGRMLDLLRTDIGPGAPLALERPVIGRTYTLFGSGLGSGGIVAQAIGLAGAHVDLTPFGAPGCFLDVDYIALIGQLADGAGTALVTLPLTEDPTLLGLALVEQLGVLDFSNPLGVTTSNSVTAVMGY